MESIKLLIVLSARKKENKKEPMPTIDKYIEEFKKVFPLLRVFPSPENGQEIERFCDEEIKSWLSHALQTYGEERYEEGWKRGSSELVSMVHTIDLPRAEKMVERIEAKVLKDGEAQGIRHERERLKIVMDGIIAGWKDPEFNFELYETLVKYTRDSFNKLLQALLPPNE